MTPHPAPHSFPRTHREIGRAARRRGLLSLLGVAALALSAACSSSPEDSPADAPASSQAPESPPARESPAPESPTTKAPVAQTPSPPADDVVITIKGFEYVLPASVPAGSTITVVNEDREPHTVTATGEKVFDVNVAGGATETFTAAAGTYEFVCTFHGNMKGTLVVE